MGKHGGALAKEWSEQTRISRTGCALAIGHHIDDRTEPERIREQDKLLALFIRDVAHGGQELDARQPFLGSQLNFASEIMKMIGEGAHNLLEPWVLAFRHSGDRIMRNPGCG
jgi:hypothetical protein